MIFFIYIMQKQQWENSHAQHQKECLKQKDSELYLKKDRE